jgi:hypothetical protein
MNEPSCKLNIFQRGILQKTASLAIYFISFAAVAFILDWLEKRRFSVVVEKAKQQGILTAESFRDLKTLIVAMDESAIFAIIVVVVLCGGIGWLLMRWAANFNWSWPVTLPRAMEFRSAMRRLNVMDLAGEIECVRRHKLSVFIALAPLRQEEQEMVRAQLYAAAHHMFSKNDVFERHIGKQTLCLDAAEYERVAEKVKQEVAERESVLIAAKNNEIEGLRTALASATQELAELRNERDELRGKVQIQPAQEKDRVDRLRVERLQWAALTPIIAQCIANPKKDGKYTTPDIEAAFAAAWQARADLREAMLRLTGSEEAKPSEAVIAAVKAELKDAGLFSSGGRPRKNP